MLTHYLLLRTDFLLTYFLHTTMYLLTAYLPRGGCVAAYLPFGVAPRFAALLATRLTAQLHQLAAQLHLVRAILALTLTLTLTRTLTLTLTLTLNLKLKP